MNENPIETILQNRGLFISVEAIDGAGKSSTMERLVQVFKEAGHPVVLTREPGGTPLAEELRTLLLNRPMDVMTEAMLFAAGRRDHIETVIKPALLSNNILICDRHADSSAAYQVHGKGLNPAVFEQLTQWAVGEIKPDITIWFDLPVEEAERRRGIARTPDRFESEQRDFFRRVAEGYRARMEAEPDRFIRINANQSREAVWDDLVVTLGDRLSELSEKLTVTSKPAPTLR